MTSLINNLYALAEAEHDYASRGKLDWFVAEQVEEEENCHDLISRIKLAGDSALALYQIDQELAARVFVTPSPLANA